MRTVKLTAAITALLLMSAPVVAQDWPTRPLTMVVPTTPGGAPDLLGRVMASRLSELLGQPVIVENVAGAGGMIGAARVARAPADGYQFLIGYWAPKPRTRRSTNLRCTMLQKISRRSLCSGRSASS